MALFFLLINFFGMQAQYPFIRHDLNQIILPADSSAWKALAKKINAAGSGGSLNIVHFGDSHIQGDYFTGQVRKHLFSSLKIAERSRGITMPYRALGTNGPDELFARKEGTFEVTSVRKNMPAIFALSGYCLTATSNGTITVTDTSSGHRFNKIKVFHSPLHLGIITVNNFTASSVKALDDSLYVSEFVLQELQNDFNLHISNASVLNKVRFYAFLLENDKSNVSYSSVGVNGATFGSFLNLYGNKAVLRFLNPDCIVFSYGTNDALHRLDSTLIKTQIISCINEVKSALPGCAVIFTTPGDHLIQRKGPNPRMAYAARLIKNTVHAEGCAVWDFFSIMGGPGSVKEWYSRQLVFRDGIHLSKKGYRYQGDLFFEAFIKLKKLEN